jgi:hypothetical protein
MTTIVPKKLKKQLRRVNGAVKRPRPGSLGQPEVPVHQVGNTVKTVRERRSKRVGGDLTAVQVKRA